MPTIIIESNVEDAALRQRAARGWSLWLRREGVDINHVITKFLPLSGERVFSGPFPFADGKQRRAFAFVRCVVGVDRPEAFRRGLAEQIVRNLSPQIDPALIFVQFEAVDPATHLIGTQLLADVREERADEQD